MSNIERISYNQYCDAILRNITNKNYPSMWTHGFPLEAFLEYIQQEKKKYPVLAQRMKLKRFTELFEKPQVFDMSIPHLEFESGCLVYDEQHQIHLHVVKIHQGEDPIEATCIGITAEDAYGIVKNSPWKTKISHLTHSCPGALEPGGEQ